MSDAPTLTDHYDRAADKWGDKMRTLGYADAYLGFLAAASPRPVTPARVLDVGCGTGSFAEAWVGIFGAQSDITLLEPSASMLARAKRALAQRNAAPQTTQAGIDDFTPSQPFDHLLVAHVIEHFADPTTALKRMRDWVEPGARLWLAASKPHWCNAIIWLQWRHQAFDASDVAQMLEASGWRLDETYPFPSGPPSRTSRGYVATAI